MPLTVLAGATETAAPPRVGLVCMNYAPEVTGIGPYTAGLAEGLAQAGFEVSVRTAVPHYPAWRAQADESDQVENGVRVARLRSYIPRHPGFATRAVFEILYGLRFAARSLRHLDVVVLVSPALFASVIVRLRIALSLHRPATILWIQDRYSAGVREISGSGQSLPQRLVHWVESSLAQSCDRVVVIHERWKSEIALDLGVSKQKISVVRNWTHVELVPGSDVAVVRESLGWDSSETVVLHCGNMGAKQGLDTVIEAARLSESEGHSLRFVLMGDGNQRERLERAAQGCSRIQFVDPQPEGRFTQILAAADILLVNEMPGMCSTAVPSKLTSYFTAGRPVLAATDPTSVTAAEVLASGAGELVRPGSARELVNGARALAADLGRVDRAAGPAYVNSVLRASVALDAFTSLINSLDEHDVADAQSGVSIAAV
jgi:colanic acid biosynthesis glycosyl transferase WcaI